MRHHRIAALVVSAVIIALAVVSAQSNLGNIRGVVRDSGGGVLPGAHVRVLGEGVPGGRSTITDSNGQFTFAGVPFGRYTVTAVLEGFTTATAAADLQAGATLKLTLTLAVASLAETVTVTGASPTLQTDSSRQRASAAIALPFNTEAYDRINDNEWTEVARKPLSTFSTDVDTASYSNVRRFLKQGQAPPKDAVRIEELINYFPFNYPEPRDGAPIAVTSAVGDCPWNASHRLALIGIQARRIDASRLPPRNLVFLIDVSGSMADQNKLPLVKASLAMLAPNLTGKDRVAIVVYAGNTGLVLPSTSGGDTPAILDALHRLEAGGSTNGGDGLILAYKVAQQQFVAGGVNRVILATDGDFNVGVTDQGSLLRLIEDKRKSGIALSVLGFGMGNVKDSTMEKLADTGNGNYSYIDSLAEARKVLVEQAGGTLVTVAKDVKLQIEFNPRSVAAYRLIGYENRLLNDQDFNNDEKDAGDMGAGHSVTALYELVPAGQAVDAAAIDPLKYQRPAAPTRAAARDEVMTVKIRYKQPEADASALSTVTVSAGAKPSAEMGFAAAVAEFGMLLRGSAFAGSASYSEVRALARQFKGEDAHGHRAEFIRLVDAAEGISRLRAAR
jgi:Ca-activated chloride channel family protein